MDYQESSKDLATMDNNFRVIFRQQVQEPLQNVSMQTIG